MNYRLASAVAAVLAASPAQVVWAQASGSSGLEEVVVTAQRRSESLQDVPLSIQALTGDTLKEMKVSTIDEFVKFLPNVTIANWGPGATNIYMRGLSVGVGGAQGSGTFSPWPNVAVYYDEQPTQIPGRNLDVYTADLERIEVLEGPQGTLFGAGAQAGVLRYITNKPDLNDTTFNALASYSTTAHGADSNSLEATLNVPIIDGKLAARVVVYNDTRGGYIDNVGSTFTRRGTDLGFALRTGGRVPTDSMVINNYNIAQHDINDVTYKGLRAGLKWQINDDWDALLVQTFQQINSDGVFYQMPTGSEGQNLKPLQVTLFNDTYIHDDFSNTALTVNGKIGTLDFVYAGAYLSRTSDQVGDYTNYARGVWGTYYQCTGYSGNSVNKCYSPSSVWKDKSDNTNQSHEIRLASPSDWRMRFVTGLFYERRELHAQTDWMYKSVPECPDGGQPGLSCFLYLDPAQAPKFESAVGDLNDPGRRNSATGFFNDFTREYKQYAAFASVDFDILDNLTLTLGTRYFDIKNEMVGANVGSFFCKVYGTGESGPCNGSLYGYGDVKAPYGTNVSAQKDNNNSADGFRSRANLTWRITDDILVYGTWSEGYRPGGFNRGSGCGLKSPTTGQNQWCFPTSYDSDDLTNIEFGWKSMLLGGKLQFNGALYQEKWDNVQVGIFAPQLGFPNLTANLNGPNYEVKGVEFSFMAAPIDGLTVSGAASFNNAELKNSPQFINNIPGDPNEGEAITESCVGTWSNGVCNGNVVSIENVFGTPGTEMAFAPKVQWNLRARYGWDMAGYETFVTGAVQYQDDSWSSASTALRIKQPSWTTMDASFGLGKDDWTAELYVINLTDENKSLFSSNAQFIETQVPMRPRTIGLRVGYKFGGQ